MVTLREKQISKFSQFLRSCRKLVHSCHDTAKLLIKALVHNLNKPIMKSISANEENVFKF